MEYKRRVSHQQFSSKGGRVKHRSSDNHGPAAKKSKGIEQDADEDAIEAVDMASYAENALYLITFEGRRREILANKFGNNADILQRACPVFNQSAYLQHEFELIKGKGICNTFMNNWTIMFLNTLEISKIIRLYKKRDLQESFDVCACTALEVLPLLIPVRNKKGVVASQFLYYLQEESVSL
ncbi:hypothetical protein OUZ56_012618 [Daphnia magna]|uniref:Uncharacterized protein n=1 Tax=Daphnia magna TaxID=35525 RepID=A0ABQ9Z3I7_9CRUS|nr:hypothetical protein OUZ56_012618 [Daphnia magna]